MLQAHGQFITLGALRSCSMDSMLCAGWRKALRSGPAGALTKRPEAAAPLRGVVVSASGKGRDNYCHVSPGKLNASELLGEASKSYADAKRGLYSRAPISARVTCLPRAWHPVSRQQDPRTGQRRERENLPSARIGGQGRTCP